MQRSVTLGGLAHAVQVHQLSIGDRELNCSALQGTHRGDAAGVPLDCFLDPLQFVDIVKVHIGYAEEFSVLAGLVRSLRAGKIGLCILRTTELTPSLVNTFVEAHGLPYHFNVARDGKDTILRLLAGA